MVYALILVGAAAGGILIATGAWRQVFRPFTISPSRMTVERLELYVDRTENVARVDAILGSFVGGFNRMLVSPDSGRCLAYCDSLPALYQPFAHEGLAMGYTLRHLFRYRSDEFERRLVKVRPEFRYLYYVGLGFWSGLRNHAASKVMRRAEGLDPLYRYLCFDGYGFKFAFFDFRRDPSVLERLEGLHGYARSAAYHGVGRALFFLYMDRPGLLVQQMERLGRCAEEAAAGVGLAAVFVNPDRLDAARDVAASMPEAWRPHVHLGMCFGLKARSIADVDRFEADISSTGPAVRDAIWASIRECDRVELLVRSERRPDAYREWRRRVTEWMMDHVDYPLAGLRPAAGRAVRSAPSAMKRGVR